MTPKTLKQLINQGEGQTLEFKLRPSEDIGKTICAFANTNDGAILVGISDSKDPVGASRKMESQIASMAHSCKPSIYPEIEALEIDGKVVLVVTVERSGGIYAYRNIAYKRVGSHDQPLSPEEVIAFARNTGRIRFDTQLCEEATPEDLDEKRVQWFLRKAMRERNLDIDPDTPLKEVLGKLDLVVYGKLTNAAVLVFGKRPQRFFLQARIRCARFKGTRALDFIDMKVLDGTIPDLREKAMNFVVEHTRHAVVFDANRRYDRWEYPLRAVEEALTNALAHRDYFSDAEIHFSIFDDRIEIWNPGELPEPLTPEDLKREHKSIPRNRLIANALFLIKYIERWGTGTNRMMEEMKAHALPEPDFRNTSGGFEVVLTGPGKSFEEEVEKGKLHLLELNARQQKAIEFIKKRGRMTRREYSETNHIGATYAKRELNEMIAKKIVRRIGRGKSTYYVLVTE